MKNAGASIRMQRSVALHQYHGQPYLPLVKGLLLTLCNNCNGLAKCKWKRYKRTKKTNIFARSLQAICDAIHRDILQHLPVNPHLWNRHSLFLGLAFAVVAAELVSKCSDVILLREVSVILREMVLETAKQAIEESLPG